MLSSDSKETGINDYSYDIFKTDDIKNNALGRLKRKKKFKYIDLYIVTAVYCANIIAIVYFLLTHNYSYEIAFVTNLIPMVGFAYIVIRNIIVFSRFR